METGWQSIVMSVLLSICVSVCTIRKNYILPRCYYLLGYSVRSSPISVLVIVTDSRGSTLRYVMYFQFYGWHHISQMDDNIDRHHCSE